MAVKHLFRQYWQELHGTSPFNLFFFSLTFFFFLYLLKLKNGKKKLKLPPSPPKLPIIGNLHQLGSLPHRSFRALADKYGPLMLLHLGHSPTLVVSSPELAREVLKTHDIIFANRPITTAANFFLYGCKDIGFAPYGEYWRQIRKIGVLELLSLKRVHSFQFIREEEVDLLIKTIRSLCINGQKINLSNMLSSTSNNIVSRAALGRKYEVENGQNDFGKVSREVMELLTAFSIGDFYPSMGWMDALIGLKAKIKKTFKVLDDLFDQVINEHQLLGGSNHYKSDKEDLVDVLLHLQKNDMVGINLSRDSIKAILLDMFVGGTDTTSTTTEWTISELVRNPISMKKAQEEVRTVVGTKQKLEEKDMTKMKYLKNAIKETLRLHPPLPLLLPRESSAPIKLGDYDIPAKTRLFFNVWAMQRDPKLWNRPEQFIPERFSDNPIDFTGQDYEYMPFGSGRRGCPGLSFGLIAVEYVVASLLYWFNWELPDGANGESLDMTEAYGLTVTRKANLYLIPKLYSP